MKSPTVPLVVSSHAYNLGFFVQVFNLLSVSASNKMTTATSFPGNIIPVTVGNPENKLSAVSQEQFLRSKVVPVKTTTVKNQDYPEYNCCVRHRSSRF